MRRLIQLLSAVLCLTLAGPAARAAEPMTVFAAASMQEALTEAGDAFTRASKQPVRFSFGASSAMARQIEQGAPADVFVSADEDWMDYLAQRRLIVAATRHDIAANRLALIAPVGSKVRLTLTRGMPLARALGAGRLALADPAAVPAGKYAKASLTALGVWSSVEAKVAPAENVRAALAYVARGEASLGIVYATDAKVEPRVRVVGLLPAASHPPIRYPAAVIAASKAPAASGFVNFLRGRAGQAILRRHGFAAVG